MSSVLHPVGPEPRERYWVRRVAVLVAAVVAIGIVIALVGNAMSAGSAVQAEPAPPSVVVPTLPATPSASPSPSGAASPTPGDTPVPGATPSAGGTPTTATTSSASPRPTGSVVTPDPGQTPKTEKKTAPTQADKKKAEAQAAAKKAAAKKKAAATVLASCPASDVRTTLIGPKKVTAKKSATFAVSLVNDSKKSCFLKATGGNFTLTVVSGKDRVWSTEDCASTVPAQSRKLAPQKSVDWKIRWNGRRSAEGCKNASENPRPGYYWAIANYDDASEVRWRIIVT